VRNRLLVAFLLVIAVGALGSAFVGPERIDEGRNPPPDQLIEPVEGDTYVWPYTSRSRSIEGRTLALNVVLVGTPAEVHSVLTDRSELEWSATEGDQSLDESRSVAPWRAARGAARYTYVGSHSGSGRWVESDYQLATGTYLGSRTHIRAYPGPSEDWTALQTHTEYWDWYRLRHSVTGVSEGARTLEGDLRDEPFVGEVRRVYHGQAGGGSDGWLTVIELTAATRLIGTDPGPEAEASTTAAGALAIAPVVAVLAGWLPAGRDRREFLRATALPIAIVAIVLGVRTAGVAAEGLLPAVNPKIFAGVLYPVLITGPLVAVVALARDRPATRIALLAAAGLGAGFVFDLSVVGVRVVPVRLVLHRTALVGALGLFTLGIARSDRRTAAAGLAAWIGVLAASLVGLV
jgi:hypothetical protein